MHSSVYSDGEEDVCVLREVDLGPKWICFTGWAGRWPLDRLSREWAYNQVLQVACRSWPFPCCLRGINLLAFNLLPKCVVGRPLPIAGPEGVLLLDEPTGQILPGVYLHLSLTSQLSSTGVPEFSVAWNRRVDLPSSLTHGEVVPRGSQIE